MGRLREVYDFTVWNFWLLAGMVVLCGLVVLLVYTMALYRDSIYETIERFIEAVARFYEGPESSRDGAIVLWLRSCASILATLGGPGTLSGRKGASGVWGLSSDPRAVSRAFRSDPCPVHELGGKQP